MTTPTTQREADELAFSHAAILHEGIWYVPVHFAQVAAPEAPAQSTHSANVSKTEQGIDTSATTASASDGAIYESVSRRANPEGHAEAMAQMDEVLAAAQHPAGRLRRSRMSSITKCCARFSGTRE